MNPPTTHPGAAFASLGVLAAGGTVGGLFGSVLTRKRSVEQRANATGLGAITGVLATGLGGIAAAAISPKWRRLGFWTAGIGVGGITAAMLLAEGTMFAGKPGKPKALPPGKNGVVAELLLRPGTMGVTAAAGTKLTLLAPQGGALQSVAATGMNSTPVTGSWITLNVPGPGVVELQWTDESGVPQTTALTVAS